MGGEIIGINNFIVDTVKNFGSIKRADFSQKSFDNGFVDLFDNAVEAGLIKSTQTSDGLIYHL